MNSTLHHFSVKGRNFEIRSIPTEEGIKFACFENNQPTGVTAVLTLETESDFSAYGFGNARVVLVDAMERYIRDALESQ